MKKKFLSLAMGVCTLALTSAAISGCVASVKANAYELSLSQELSYEYGNAFVAPDATITYNGGSVAATRVALILPDGVMLEGDSHVIQQEGTYTLVYYATVNGKVVSAKQSFHVSKTTQDITAPTILLDERFGKGTNWKIAVNETVKIPAATAIDEHLLGGVETTVYYNYGTKAQQTISVQNGEFTPFKLGEHAIVYSARDSFGNEASETVFISCAMAEDNVAVKLTTQTLTGEAGAELVVPDCAISGLYTDLSNLRIWAVFEGETKRTEITNNRYFPRNVGEYTIVYEYETPFKTYSATTTLTTTTSQNVEITPNALPQYYIKGARYTLDAWAAYQFTEKHPTQGTANAFVKSDGGEYVAIDYKDFTVQANSTVQFKFAYGGKELETEIFKVVDVGFGGKLNLKEYFQGEGFDKSAKDSTIFVKDGEGNYTLDFINALSLSVLNFEFTVPSANADTGEKYDELQAIDITITDYYNRKKSVTARYENNAGALSISFNGGKKTNTAKAFAGVKNAFFYTNGYFGDSSGASWAWENDFQSDKVLLSITFVGVDGNAGLSVQRVGEQGFNATSDRIESTVYIPNPQSGIHQRGDVLTLCAAQITDVLSPYLEGNHTFEVLAPNGKFVTSLDGVLLDGTCDVSRSYQIKLESFGDYIVRYTYKDQNGNESSAFYGVNVPERVAPTITLNGVKDGDMIAAKLNTWVSIAKYTASDDLTQAEELRAFVEVFDPDYLQIDIENGKFAAVKTGDYVVYYSCYDAEGNFTTVSYVVRVR